MINSAEYSADGKFLVLPSLYIGGEEKKVPVALIDELRERGLSKYDLERLLFVRSVTAGNKTRKVKMEDLVGEDLTGKTVGVYFRNYEDSEWMETSEAIGVVKDEEGADYRFLFPPEYETCWEGECAHYDENASEDAECLTDSLQRTYFWCNETVLVTEKESK
jgi:hypothetical protein